MPDQADILRHLVADAFRGQSSLAAPAPPMIAVAGAKGGVGTTCVAITLAESLARQGQRVVLVDVDSQSANVAALCGVTERYTTGDVLSGRREIHEVLQSAPGGLQIAAGAWGTGDHQEIAPAAQRRLIDQLRRLGNFADVIVLDVGCSHGLAALEYWRCAECVLLVTTPDPIAVMDAYAAVKIATTHDVATDIELVVNQTENGAQGTNVHERIDLSCQRFLGVHVAFAGDVPFDPRLTQAAREQNLLALPPETSPAAQALEFFAAERNFAALAAA
jgi:flagellar biosynthesis protein FlhG